MTITVTAAGPIPNGVVRSATNTRDATTAIGLLELADVWRGLAANPIANSGTIRIDCQGVDANGRANLQAQINGIYNASSTIAHVLVDQTVGAASGQARVAQQANAIRQIRSALNSSMTSGNTYYVTGTPTG